jgi:hypothetical protein
MRREKALHPDRYSPVVAPGCQRQFRLALRSQVEVIWTDRRRA